MVTQYKPLYTVKEASQVLLLSKNEVYTLIKSGELQAVKLGALKVRGSDLEQFIEKYPAVDTEKCDCTA